MSIAGFTMFKYVLRTVGGMQPHVNKVADTAAFRVKKGIACHATSVVRVKPLPDDTWCLGCSAWESLGTELCASWSQPALRQAAVDIVVNTVREVRTLRGISSSLRSAESFFSCGLGSTLVRGPAHPPEHPNQHRGLYQHLHHPQGLRLSKSPSESEEHERDSEDEEVAAPATTAAPKSDPSRRPPEPRETTSRKHG